MSDRTFTNFATPSPWLWRQGWSTPGVARTPTVEQRGTRFGLADFGGVPNPGAPRRPGLRAMLRAAWRRHRTRRCLAELDGFLLKDIGLSYADAEAEVNKPFWVG
jgi:uncharacterized protein YjiS (DUF1127 family)